MLARVLFANGLLILCLNPALPTAGPDPDALRKVLTFHASFDGQTDADFARGDRRLYTASNTKRADAKPGLHRADVALAKGKGKFGDALQFGGKERAVLFFQGDRNMAYRPRDWSGTVSFWLSLDPDKDLQPGYCDPIQITDKRFDDAAFFVDFTKAPPRHFRLGVYPDVKLWNPKGLKAEKMPTGQLPLSEEIAKLPFARDKWTHVAFTFANLNTGKPNGIGKLYLDGKPVTQVAGRELTFTWEPSRVAVMFGLSYTGLFDDLALFDRALTEEEVAALSRLEGGVRSLGP
jgi:hypothetical protein